MKCTTHQTVRGALEGTPFPPIWLKRFSELVPISIFSLMSRTCKRIHQHLRLNAVWKERCQALPEWDNELSEWEKTRMVPTEEGFWYEWWCDRVPRRIPLRVHPGGIAWNTAGPGTLCSKHDDWNDSKYPILVIISEIFQPREKRNGSFTFATILDPLTVIRQTNTVRFKMNTKYKVAIRPNGNTAVFIALVH